jgi:hypothetical protein
MRELSILSPAAEVMLHQVFAGLRRLLETDPSLAEPFLSRLPSAPYRRNDGQNGETHLPVLRFWPDCLRQDGDPATGLSAVASALVALTPDLRWRQNPNYRHTPPSAGFLENYGYAEICGRYGLIDADIRFGVLILGPETCYPSHRHPAEEIYLPLGAGDWQRGEVEVASRDWHSRPAGTLIHHPPFVPHATRAGRQALAALYLWSGDLATEAKLDS